MAPLLAWGAAVETTRLLRTSVQALLDRLPRCLANRNTLSQYAGNRRQIPRDICRLDAVWPQLCGLPSDEYRTTHTASLSACWMRQCAPDGDQRDGRPVLMRSTFPSAATSCLSSSAASSRNAARNTSLFLASVPTDSSRAFIWASNS